MWTSVVTPPKTAEGPTPVVARSRSMPLFVTVAAYVAFVTSMHRIGDISWPTSELIVIACLVSVLLTPTLFSATSKSASKLATATVSSLIVGAVHPLVTPFASPPLVILVVALASVLNRGEPISRHLRTISVAMFVTFVCVVVTDYTRPGASMLSAWARLAGLCATSIGGHRDNLGPTPSGVIPTLLAMSTLVIQRGWRSRLHWSLALITPLVIGVIFIAAGSALCPLLSALTGSLVTMFDLTWVLVVLQAVMVTLVATTCVDAVRTLSVRRRVAWTAAIAGGAALLCAGLLSTRPTASTDHARRTRVFINTACLDMRVPTYDCFERDSLGMFGMLGQYLTAEQFDVTTGDASDPRAWASSDVLVLINLQERFSKPVVEKMLSFVRNGGGLLLVGDHTGYEHIRLPLNDVGSQFGLALNFDSAHRLRLDWGDGKAWVHHPSTSHVAMDSDTQIWTGASVDIRWPGYQLITARYGFSDPGDISAPSTGCLGDLKYEYGEALGDIPLLGASEVGLGRVLMFGDTSSFQTGALFSSHQFVADSLNWLAGNSVTGMSQDWREACIIVGAVISLTGAMLLPDAAFLILLLSGFTIVMMAINKEPEIEEKRHPSDWKLTFIDHALNPSGTLLGWGRDGDWGLQVNLLRRGHLPFRARVLELQALKQCDEYFITAPTRDATTQEAACLRSWIAGGGTAVLTLGQPEASVMQNLLGAVDASVGRDPLGPMRRRDVSGLGVPHSAYELRCESTAEMLTTVLGRPVAATWKIGAGTVVFVADSEFLSNKNLEDLGDHSDDNIAFVRSLLNRIDERNKTR